MTINTGRGVTITIKIEIAGQPAEPQPEVSVPTVFQDPYYEAMHGHQQPSYPTVDEK